MAQTSLRRVNFMNYMKCRFICLNKVVFSLLFLVHFCVVAEVVFTPTKRACKEINRNIDHLNSQMRAGYSLKEGERYRKLLKALKDNRRLCKKKKYPVE